MRARTLEFEFFDLMTVRVHAMGLLLDAMIDQPEKEAHDVLWKAYWQLAKEFSYLRCPELASQDPDA